MRLGLQEKEEWLEKEGFRIRPAFINTLQFNSQKKEQINPKDPIEDFILWGRTESKTKTVYNNDPDILDFLENDLSQDEEEINKLQIQNKQRLEYLSKQLNDILEEIKTIEII